MKAKIANAALLFLIAIMFSSCYNYTTVVGKGAQGNQSVTKWNNYLIFGLVSADVSNSQNMAEGAIDYTVHTRHTFVNGLLTGITLGVYAPTTTTVTH